MFVHDRQFFIVDPARSLYNVTAMYASNMVANSALTILNAGIFMLLMYALIGARASPALHVAHVRADRYALCYPGVASLCAHCRPFARDAVFVRSLPSHPAASCCSCTR